MERVYRAIKKNYVGYLFVAPLILIIVAFLAIPIAKAAQMSFQYWYMAKPVAEGNYFLGLENYKNVLGNEYFYNSVKVTGIYIVVTVIMRYALGFIAAMLLNHKFRGRGIARSLLIIPWAVPEVVACLIWILMYDKEYGIINYILMNLNLIQNNIAFLQDTEVALMAAMAVNIWKGFPFVAIMLLAAFQSIPSDLYEAAMVDGANFRQKTWHITIPSIKPVSMVVFLLLIIWTIKDFAIAFVLAKGGPSRATEILTIFVYQTAFKYFNFGEAAAAGMIMLVFSLLFTYCYFKVINRGGEEL